MADTQLHPSLQVIGWLLGRWEGQGVGLWSTESPFHFLDHMVFSHDGRPRVLYEQRTTGPDGGPSHLELGFITPADDGTYHFTVASPIGITEVLVGDLSGTALQFSSVDVGHAPSTDDVTSIRRRLALDLDGALTAEVAIGVNGEEAAPHTESHLSRR